MDRGKTRSRLLIGAALALLAVGAATPQLPIREAHWLRSPDLVANLTMQPGECVAWPAAPPLNDSARIGRAAFQDPLLLGGQAARAGLSCSSCHRNGRNNPDFHFPGISGAPGTADVTASLLSSHRGDGKFNPKRIPDLADPKQQKVSRDLRSDDLHKFIHGLIVEEFDGPEPPPAIMQGLLDYVRFMDLTQCRKEGPISLADALTDVEAAIRLAEESLLISHDKATARFLIGAARSQLGRIDERFSIPGLDAERAALRDASVELGELQDDLSSANERSLWLAWSERWPRRKEQLMAAEPRSLYSEALLRRYVGQRLTNRD